ncbi:flagellar hook-length control protein FliK [Vreelandella aquamarina]|uniref:flagellar hook-length control protein FliK n=1 Tax=Vreelandella aquamarina TaxID=77097 RepID=UPI00384D9BF5
MSGITPLIDTLLHQVLGRQGEVSSQRALNAPVQPVLPGEGPRALQGDAGLDGRPLSSPLGDLKRLPGTPEGLRQPLPGGVTGEAPSSTQTHFSPAARTIADVLLRFPGPPAVMKPPAPLMSMQEAPSAPVLANRLEASIRDSGLFYESHLKRWFQGEVSRQQLLREPQMQPGPRPAAAFVPNFLSTTPPMSPSASAPRFITTPGILPNTPLVPVSGEKQLLLERPAVILPASNSPAPVAAERREVSPASLTLPVASELETSSRGSREIVHESLQGIVRQQLEMLVMPTLRWEGDVWAGIFMALVVNLPGREGGKEGASGEEGAEESWRSEMQLEVPNLGSFSVAIWLHQKTLSIDLTTDNAVTHQHLEEGIGSLEQRLNALDFHKVQVKARFVTLERHHDDLG